MLAVSERMDLAVKREYEGTCAARSLARAPGTLLLNSGDGRGTGFANFEDRYEAAAHEITVQLRPLLYPQPATPVARVPGMGLTSRLMPTSIRESTFPDLTIPTQVRSEPPIFFWLVLGFGLNPPKTKSAGITDHERGANAFPQGRVSPL
eukprot:scaffold434_cov186-Pinguiococcus_pyrenoidosus.AAC.118